MSVRNESQCGFVRFSAKIFLLDTSWTCVLGSWVCLARHGGPLTQEVEYLPFKQRVAGSNPARPTNHGRGEKQVKRLELSLFFSDNPSLDFVLTMWVMLIYTKMGHSLQPIFMLPL
jgi:hypothetical protein